MAEKNEQSFLEKPVNTHFTLAVISVIISCFTGFWTIPLALVQNNRWQEARQSAWWTGLFGWLTVAIAFIPVLLVLFFGGAILAFLGALLSAA